MAQMSKEEFDNITFQQWDKKPDREKKEKSNTRKFWFLSVPAGAFFGFVAMAVTGAGSSFWFAWVLSTLFIQGWVESK